MLLCHKTWITIIVIQFIINILIYRYVRFWQNTNSPSPTAKNIFIFCVACSILLIISNMNIFYLSAIGWSSGTALASYTALILPTLLASVHLPASPMSSPKFVGKWRERWWTEEKVTVLTLYSRVFHEIKLLISLGSSIIKYHFRSVIDTRYPRPWDLAKCFIVPGKEGYGCE